ncbi:hypothetical protein LJC40_05285 [Synergistaceae bacterium OttesenSCG-928-D05]|nr:hypothetical protein [Synergistaceae bacterium OttesenSCG-928-D05]
MSLVYMFFQWVMKVYTPETSVRVIRMACVTCSLADIGFILILLKLSSVLKPADAPKPRKRIWAMYFFLALTPTLVIPNQLNYQLIWQSFVLGFPYLILAYTAVKELPLLLGYVKSKIVPKLEN